MGGVALLISLVGAAALTPRAQPPGQEVAQALYDQARRAFFRMEFSSASAQLEAAAREARDAAGVGPANPLLRDVLLLLAWTRLEEHALEAAAPPLREIVRTWPGWAPDPERVPPSVLEALTREAAVAAQEAPAAKSAPPSTSALLLPPLPLPAAPREEAATPPTHLDTPGSPRWWLWAGLAAVVAGSAAGLAWRHSDRVQISVVRQ